jgi:hypothetical protein
VFTVRRVVAGETVVIFGGTVLLLEDARRAGSRWRSRTIQIDDDRFLYSVVEGPADWINHSCKPNCGMQGPITVVAMRDISPGEELTFDYATVDGVAYDEFDCLCNEPSCRGRITGDDWMLPDLQARYAGWFSPYLQRRIDALGRLGCSGT